jgi:plastocyanin
MFCGADWTQVDLGRLASASISLHKGDQVCWKWTSEPKHHAAAVPL